MNLESLRQKVADAVNDSRVDVHVGYPPTGVEAPHVTIRPLTTLEDSGAISGDAVVWDAQIGVYCVGGSVDASWNLAAAVVGLHGSPFDGNALSTAVGYTGAKIEGNYETQVTVQTYRGDF